MPAKTAGKQPKKTAPKKSCSDCFGCFSGSHATVFPAPYQDVLGNFSRGFRKTQISVEATGSIPAIVSGPERGPTHESLTEVDFTAFSKCSKTWVSDCTPQPLHGATPITHLVLTVGLDILDFPAVFNVGCSAPLWVATGIANRRFSHPQKNQGGNEG